MSKTATFRSYAKINLYLDVLQRRRDGYHNLETIFQSVDLCDTLEFELTASGISMECNLPDLECDEGNLVCRAARLLQEVTGGEQGVHVRLTKRIPMAAGLAGGSGNAAATLAALNGLWDLNLHPARLQELAMCLGADVPYCLVGGTMAATLRGEALAPLPSLEDAHFVLLHPPIHVSTPSIFNSPLLTRSSERPFAGRTTSFRAAIRAFEAGRFSEAVFNRMEGPVFAQHPTLAEAKARLLEAGCLAAAMSGSGPTLFGVCRSKRHAEEIAGRFSDYACSVVSSTTRGLQNFELSSVLR